MTSALRDFALDLWRKYRRDHVSILVSSLAYYTFFSFFPLLLVVASVFGFLFGMGEDYARIPRQVLGMLPVSSTFLENSLERILHARRSLGVLGSALLIWSSTAAFDALQQILNRIHQAPTMRPLWRRRLLGLLLGVILILFIPLSIGMAGLGPMVVGALIRAMAIPETWGNALNALCSAALGILFNFMLFTTLYLFGPLVRRQARQIWPGALAGAVLWEISKAIFGVYVRSLSTYKMLYGSIGSIIAILLWIYVSGTLVALGAEINFVLAERRGEKLTLHPRAPGDRRAGR